MLMCVLLADIVLSLATLLKHCIRILTVGLTKLEVSSRSKIEMASRFVYYLHIIMH